jgi:hypothetical protein
MCALTETIAIIIIIITNHYLQLLHHRKFTASSLKDKLVRAVEKNSP